MPIDPPPFIVWRRLLAAMVMATVVCLPASRGDDEAGPAITTAGVALGSPVSGPVLTAESLAHRVVVLEFWGVNCPPCLRSMPALEKLHRELAPAGLVVVGAHAQPATVAEIKEVVDQLGVTFAIVEQATVRDAMDFTGIPHCMVFDHTGACVYRGHPSKAHDVIVAAVRSSPAAVLEGRELVKLAPLARQLHDEAAFGGVLKKAQGLAKSSDPATASEASYLVDKLGDYGTRLLAAAEAAQSDDPRRAVHYAQRCAVGFRGTASGTQAADLLRDWKKDAAFQNAIKAARQCRQLETARAKIAQALGGPEEITPELAARVPEGVRKQLMEVVGSIHRLSPGSLAAARADEIATELRLAGGPETSEPE
jgi:thiol-disulfide isomerase/thioredoxin